MRNYLVIGGSSGIGKAIVSQLAEDGNRVWATYHKNKQNSESALVSYHPLDVRQEDQHVDFVPEKLEGMVYCPGSINLLPFGRMKPVDFQADFELQVLGAVKVLQSILPRLKASNQASVVFFSTVAVQQGFPFHSQVSASKGAVEGLTRALAAEFAPTIRFNAIAPSIVDTPLASRLLNTEEKRKSNAHRHPLKRFGSPDDIASMASFLLSEKSGWITGQVLAVDGGVSSLNV